MSFFEFPRTRTYDSDLGWLIKNVKSISDLVEVINAWKAQHEIEYDELANEVDGLIHNLVDVISPWDSSVAYHIFSIVEYQGTNYIAIQDVPVGAMITNTDYWQPANTVIEQINAIGTTVSGFADDIARLDRYIMPADYGAVGDGLTDDSIAFLNMFTDAVDNGKNIYIPDGEYLINSRITIPANQNGMIIKGAGKWRSRIIFGTNAAGFTFTDCLRYDISELYFQSTGTETEAAIRIEGVAHLSIIHDCVVESNMGIYADNCGYFTVRDTSFKRVTGLQCKYLIRVAREYIYIINCYFEGLQETVEGDVAVWVDHALNTYIQNCDICNFFGGSGLLIKPTTSGGTKNTVIENTIFTRNKYNIDFVCDYGITETHFHDCVVYDYNIADKNIRATRTGTALVVGVYGNIRFDGSWTAGAQLVNFGGLYRGEGLISVTMANDNNYFDYLDTDPITIIIGQLYNPQMVASGSNSDHVDIQLLSTSPFKDFNLPIVAGFKTLNGRAPQSVTLYNTFGGAMGVRVNYDGTYTTLFSSLIVKLTTL